MHSCPSFVCKSRTIFSVLTDARSSSPALNCQPWRHSRRHLLAGNDKVVEVVFLRSLLGCCQGSKASVHYDHSLSGHNASLEGLGLQNDLSIPEVVSAASGMCTTCCRQLSPQTHMR